MALPGETEAGSAGKQPCRGIARRAHRDDDHGRGTHLSRSSQNPIGSKDPDALKIPARRAASTLTRSARSPVPAEPAHGTRREAKQRCRRTSLDSGRPAHRAITVTETQAGPTNQNQTRQQAGIPQPPQGRLFFIAPPHPTGVHCLHHTASAKETRHAQPYLGYAHTLRTR